MPIGSSQGWRETHYRTRSIGYGRQIRLSEVAPLEEDRHLIGLGAGIGEAIGQVKLGGMSPALADCLSYACAKASQVPILFKGRDFGKTDLQAVPY